MLNIILSLVEFTEWSVKILLTLSKAKICPNPVLDVRYLQVKFAAETKPVVAVEDLTFQLRKGEKLGIVGESGSEKSVTSLAIMGFVPTPGKITQWEILFIPEGKSAVDLLQVNEAERRSYRRGAIAMIFQ